MLWPFSPLLSKDPAKTFRLGSPFVREPITQIPECETVRGTIESNKNVLVKHEKYHCTLWSG